MRTYERLILAIVIAAPFSYPSQAQTAPPLPTCEPAQEVRKALEDQLDRKLLDRMKFPDRIARERQVLEELIAKYPRELAPPERLRDLLHQYVPDGYRSLREQWIKMTKDNPDDPLALNQEAIEDLWTRPW